MLPKLNVPTRLSKKYLSEHRACATECIASKNTSKENERTPPTPNTPNNYRTMLCKFFLANTCKHGDGCAFSHNLSQFPCRAFHLRGSCTKRSCPFSHAPVSAETLQEMQGRQEEPSFKSTLM